MNMNIMKFDLKEICHMEKIIVKGGQRLKGTVKVAGAKNAVLPVIAASILASEGKSTISDVPPLADVYTINEVLRSIHRSEEHTSELQSRFDLVCRLLLEK